MDIGQYAEDLDEWAGFGPTINPTLSPTREEMLVVSNNPPTVPHVLPVNLFVVPAATDEDDALLRVKDSPRIKLDGPKINFDCRHFRKQFEILNPYSIAVWATNGDPKCNIGLGPFFNADDAVFAIKDLPAGYKPYMPVSQVKEDCISLHNNGKYSNVHYDTYSNIYIDIDVIKDRVVKEGGKDVFKERLVTEEDKDAAQKLLFNYFVNELKVAPALAGNTGNGRCIVLRANIPTLDKEKILKGLFKDMASTLSVSIAKLGMFVDPAVFDPSRIMGVFGTDNVKKGVSNPRTITYPPLDAPTGVVSTYKITTFTLDMLKTFKINAVDIKTKAVDMMSSDSTEVAPVRENVRISNVANTSVVSTSSNNTNVDYTKWDRDGRILMLMFEEYGNFYEDKEALRRVIEAVPFTIIGPSRNGEGWSVESLQSNQSTVVGPYDCEVYRGLLSHFFHASDKPFEFGGPLDYAIRYLPHIISQVDKEGEALATSRKNAADEKILEESTLKSFLDYKMETLLIADIVSIPLRLSWLNPSIVGIVNQYFRDYEKTVKLTTRLYLSLYYLVQATLKACVGKRIYYQPMAWETIYCGSDCITAVIGSGSGKSELFKFINWLYEEITNARTAYVGTTDYKMSLHATFVASLKTMRQMYSPDVKNGRTLGPPDKVTIMRACEDNPNSVFAMTEEAAKSYSKLGGDFNNMGDIGSICILTEGKAGTVSNNTRNSGFEVLSDISFVSVGVTTPTDLSDNFPLFSRQSMGSGTSARFGIVYDGEGAFLYNEIDTSVGDRNEPIEKIRKLRDTIEYIEATFNPECLDFVNNPRFDNDKDQAKHDKLMEDERDYYVSIRDKNLTKAKADAMLCGLLAGKAVTKRKADTADWKDVDKKGSNIPRREKECVGQMDCSEFLASCYKARLALSINAFYSLGVTLAHDYMKKILQVLQKAANKSLSKIEIIKSVLTKDEWRDEKLVESALERAVCLGCVLEKKLKSTGGRPPTVYCLNPEYEPPTKEM